MNILKENIGTGWYNNRVVSNVNGGFHVQIQNKDHGGKWEFDKTYGMTKKVIKYDTLEEAIANADHAFSCFN